MNPVTYQLKNHASDRKFVHNYPLSSAVVNEILLSAKQAPSWENGQAYSILVFEKEDKQKLVDCLRGEHNLANAETIERASIFLLFCIDFNHYLPNELYFSLENEVEPLMIGAVDAALAMQNAGVAAESFGLGTCIIGGIRRDAAALIQAFDLPRFLFPLAGMAIGMPQIKNHVKPRLAQAINVFPASQYKIPSERELKNYEQKLFKFAQQSQYTTQPWLKKFQTFYQVKKYPRDTIQTLKKQGLF